MKHIVSAASWQPNHPVGGKARALAELTLAELPVPAWFVVLPSAFEASVPPALRTALAQADADAPPPARLEGIALAAEVAAELAAALDGLGGEQSVFAVRSSGLEEDSARLSFAGQLESFLHVPRAGVATHVIKVWASGFSERLLRYRREMGLDPLAGAPAVIVQQMIEGEASGVAFSADPVSGRRAVAVVGAVPGLASALVSGEAESDTWRIDRDGGILERKIESKRIKHERDPMAGGVRAIQIDPAHADRPAIDDTTAAQVANLARRTERYFGRPQDIEWTLAATKLYLLQSRPITTLTDRADPDGVRALWDNSNIIESYAGITTPLTFSFARRAYEHVYREFCRLIRMPQAALEAHSDMFCCMLGLVRGRVYYNLYHWYRLVSVLPGYQFNRRFMEQMMGVRESLPEDIAAAHTSGGSTARLRDAWRLTVSLSAFAVHLFTLGRRMRRFYARLNDTLGSGRPDLSRLRPDELAAYYRRLEQRLLTHWDAPIVNDFATMIFHGLLRSLSAAWVRDGKGTLHNDLLCAEHGMISEEPARRVKDMAAIAAEDAGVAAALREGGPGAVRTALATTPRLGRAVQDYIERFGDRCMEELKLESPTLHDDPVPLWRAIGHYAARLATPEHVDEQAKDAAIRAAAEASMRTALAGHALRRLVFGWLLGRARACVRARENLRFERTRVFGRARQIVVEIGKRLAAVDCLDHYRDVFYLEIDELLGFVEGRITTTDLKGLVAVRRAEFEGYRAAPAPDDRFETRGLMYRGHSFKAAHPATEPAKGDRLTGLACCPGIVRGPVRVVRDPRAVSVKPGEIVVAERTDPGWVMIFPSATGLLVERGSLLSHSAIVARELGLPAIVSIAGLMQWLQDGDWVEMDGSTGTIVKVEAPHEHTTSAAR